MSDTEEWIAERAALAARLLAELDPDDPQTRAAVEVDHEGWVVRISTPGDERPLKIFVNQGLAFDDYPDFAIPPDWRLCPECGVNPRHKHAIFYCAWCGHKLPDYPEEES